MPQKLAVYILMLDAVKYNIGVRERNEIVMISNMKTQTSQVPPFRLLPSPDPCLLANPAKATGQGESAT